MGGRTGRGQSNEASKSNYKLNEDCHTLKKQL